MADQLRRPPERDGLVERREHEEQRHARDDLRGDERAGAAPPSEAVAARLLQRARPIAKATPSGVATSMVSNARTSVLRSASCSASSWNTDPTRPVYQRVEKPCQLERLRPLLNEKSTARSTGTTDQATYIHVVTTRPRGRPHGLARRWRRLMPDSASGSGPAARTYQRQSSARSSDSVSTSTAPFCGCFEFCT